MDGDPRIFGSALDVDSSAKIMAKAEHQTKDVNWAWFSANMGQSISGKTSTLAGIPGYSCSSWLANLCFLLLSR